MSDSPRVAVILSGCGVYDGSEIHEAVVTLLTLSRAGATVRCAAPDKPQMHVVNHLTGEVAAGHEHGVEVGGADLGQGDDVAAGDADGAAKNLSDFAVKGAEGTADPELVRVLREFHEAGKPIGAVCIAPVILVMALGEGAVTIGEDPGTAAAIESLGGQHLACPVTEMIVDEERKLVTAPAYMLDASLAQVAEGIEKAVHAVLGMCA